MNTTNHVQGPQAGTLALATLWADLAAGRLRVDSPFFDRDVCGATLRPATADVTSAPSAPSAREVGILQLSLLNARQKWVAAEVGLAVSGLTAVCSKVLRWMGLACTPCRVPPFVVMAAHAAREGASELHARTWEFTREGQRQRVLYVPRPENGLSETLAPAELAVIRALLEGRSYESIARARGRSTRTVANQVSSAFRRLGVSGRGELLCHLLDATRWRGDAFLLGGSPAEPPSPAYNPS